MTVIVRRLARADADRWRELFHAYNDFYSTTLPDAVVSATWRRLLSADEPDLVGLAALDGEGRMAGFAHVLFHRSTWSPTYYCYLEDLYVDPLERGQGAGRALIEATFAEADSRQCTRTYWMTERSNDTARRLYDRLAGEAGLVQYRR